MATVKTMKTKQEKIAEAQKEYDFCVRMHRQYRILPRLTNALTALNAAKAA
jgi:hypothetical protein